MSAFKYIWDVLGLVIRKFKWPILVIAFLFGMSSMYHIIEVKQTQINEMKVSFQDYKDAQEAERIRLKQMWEERYESAKIAHESELQRIDAESRLLQSVTNSLSDTLSIAQTKYPKADPDAKLEYTNALSNVFKECVGECQRVAKEADGHVADKELFRRSWSSN